MTKKYRADFYARRDECFYLASAGDFSILVIDSGIYATYADLPLGTKVVPNVLPVAAAGTLEDFIPIITGN